MNIKYCKDCANKIQAKPMNRCGASRQTDLVDGEERRTCMIERLDGIGRCGSMGNNFSPKGPQKPVVRKNPAVKVNK